MMPLNGSVALINGTFYLVPEPSCGDTPMLIMFLILLLLAVLAFMRSGAGAVAARGMNDYVQSKKSPALV